MPVYKSKKQDEKIKWINCEQVSATSMSIGSSKFSKTDNILSFLVK